MALPFAPSADFPVHKSAGQPCPHLRSDHRCAIHDRLIATGYRGCTVFDCLGAGQRVTHAFAPQTWRDNDETAERMFAAFLAVRELHEMSWYLREVHTHDHARSLHDAAARLLSKTNALAELTLSGDAPALLDHQRAVGELLDQASRAIRAHRRNAWRIRNRRTRRRADLAGARLAGADLRTVDLRSALLIGANLTGADLRFADLLGADLRGASISGANLDGALFVTLPQVAGARGDSRTILPARVPRPAQW